MEPYIRTEGLWNLRSTRIDAGEIRWAGSRIPFLDTLPHADGPYLGCLFYLSPSIHKVITVVLPPLINPAVHVLLHTSFSQLAGQQRVPLQLLPCVQPAQPPPPTPPLPP